MEGFLHHGRASFFELRDLRGIEQSPSHKHESRSRPLRVRAYTIEKLFSVQSRQIEIAKNEFILMSGELRKRFFGAGGSFHNHSTSSQAFLHDLANALFVVHNKDGVAAQFGGARGRGDKAGSAGRRWTRFFYRDGKQDAERGARPGR